MEKNQKKLLDSLFDYIIAVAFIALIVWSFIDAKNNPRRNHYSPCEEYGCDPRL